VIFSPAGLPAAANRRRSRSQEAVLSRDVRALAERHRHALSEYELIADAEHGQVDALQAGALLLDLALENRLDVIKERR
jgi:hypothetical protein